MPELTISAADISEMYGDYYIDQGQNAGMIKTLYRESFATKDEFTAIETNDTILREHSAEFQEVIQPFQVKWSPKGSIGFKASDIPLFQIKADLEIYPDRIVKSWLGFLTSNNLDRKEWPLIKYIIEVYVLKQIQTDLEEKAIFGGVFTAPTVEGTPGAAAESMNGIKKVINDHVTAGAIVPIATGAPSATPETWTTQIETFLDSIPDPYRDRVQRIRMSKALMRRHRRGNRAKYNSNWEVVGKDEMESFIDFPEVSAVGLPSHLGSNKIWTTTPGNNVLAMKAGSNQSIVRVENVDRLVKIYTDFWLGVGFVFPQLVYTNDQDLV